MPLNQPVKTRPEPPPACATAGRTRRCPGRLRGLLPGLALLCLPLRAAEPAPGTLFYHTSYPEASAVGLAGSPPRWLVVADNELPALALFPLEPQSSKPQAPALNAGTSPAYPVDDLEGMTLLPWDPDGDGKPEEVYHVLAGSGSRTKKGKVAPERDALFAVSTGADGKPFTAAAEVKVNRTLRTQIRALGGENSAKPWGPVLRDSVWRQGLSPEAQIPGLGGETGLNIEGLTVSRDARSLLLGLRSPLVNGRALLIPLTNPVAALGLGGSAPQPAALAEPVLLDLGGLGFRSIEWDADHKVYLIAAGSAGDAKAFRFYTWTGDPAAAPVQVKTRSALDAAEIDPEGITPVPGYKVAAVVGDAGAGAPSHTGMWVDFGGGK
jgi:hypothetical protein